MAEITTREITDKNQWEEFVTSVDNANFLQSWYWAEFQENINHPCFKLGVFEGQKMVGAMLCVVEPAKRAKYLTVPGGPLIDYSREDIFKACLQALKNLAKREACVFVRIRPQERESRDLQKLFTLNGLTPAQMHLHAELTSQLDITKDADVLRSEFRKNTRYELKQAKKRGIKVEASTNPDDIREFYDIQLQTAERHGFVPYSYDFLHEQFKVFAGAGLAKLYKSYTQQGKLIALAFVIFYNNEAAYHYGASTPLGRAEPGAYLIQWKAILEAKECGKSRYNFWGVVEPDDKEHRFYGVSVFKRGFRGEDFKHLHAHDLVIDKISYKKNFAIEFIRKRVRKV